MESLARLRPAFGADGTITAGSSSQISDGAAALVLASREAADRLGADVLAEVGAFGTVAGPDNALHSQPANAIKKALRKAGREVSDLDLIEINEAFAAVGIESMRELGVGPEPGQRQRRRDRARPPARRLWRAHRAHPRLRAAPPRRRARRRGPVRRRRPGLGPAAAGPVTALDTDSLADRVNAGDARALGRVLSLVEDGDERARSVIKDLKPPLARASSG